MTRSALFQLTILVLLLCAAVSGLLWWYVQRTELQLQAVRVELETRQEELRNLHEMTEAQEKLDKLTLDERETTQLALLKHLGLENMDLNFSVVSRDSHEAGDTVLIARRVGIQMVQSYADQMALLDKLFGNGKLQIGKVTLRRVQQADVPDPTDLSVEGTIYSLEKRGALASSLESTPEAVAGQGAVPPLGAEGEVSPSIPGQPDDEMTETGGQP